MKNLHFSEISQASKTPKGQRHWLGSLHGAAQSFTIAELSRQHDGLTVVLAKDSSHLYQLETELEFFGASVQVFADWETLPYDQLSPNQGIISERLRLLSNMPSSGILLLASNAALQRIAPPSWLLGQYFDYRVGDTLDIEAETLRLVKAGYRVAEAVYEAGEFAVRGALMDIYPMGQASPLRIELFDDEIDSIRLFDAQSQRSLETLDAEGNKKAHKLEQFRVLSAHEFPLIDGKETFRARFAESFAEVSARKVPLYEDVMNGIAPQGLEYYLPLFFARDELQESGHLFSYLPQDALIVHDDCLDKSLTHFWDELTRRHHDLSADNSRPILPPHELYLRKDRLNELLGSFARVITSETCAPTRAGASDLPFSKLPDVAADHKQAQPLAKLSSFLADHPKQKTLFAVESPSRKEVLIDLLSHHIGKPTEVANFPAIFQNHEKEPFFLSLAVLDRPLFIPNQLAVITESQLFGHEVVRTRTRKTPNVSDEYLVKSISELNVGDPVVHIDHGIGRYGGLTLLTLDDEPDEFLQINYADDAAVYVPVANLHLISRYSGGDPANAPLHRIGSDQWKKAKKKALEKIHDVAAELLDVQARRDARPGISFKVDAAAYDLFASQFAFEETPDQALAIESVLFDMKQNKPMDRLVCGDVGFGKTEVAMRAAFVAVQAGHQVAVLVPTTLLAEQHEDNFKNRFTDWPIRVEAISRFGAKKKVSSILDDTKAGKVDILIGTHKLLQNDVGFANLGLMIVDEEHRFGVRHKEKIKSMRSDVDMLTLTATPIPRTLNMSLSGMRDLSIIATPPSRRLPIKTFVLRKTDALLKEAILRELLRGGQVYYLHNDIASIERSAENIRELIPEARVVVAHGQMKAKQLERVMEDFYHKKFNVLVCTTIIETGIDIANANTILIERADKFGLAQLHQLRGRVGRSFHQAYAYMLVPSVKGLKGDAKKRLKAIQRANTLGAGFLLASEDLEIRGAGELLGSEQSGNIHAVGFSLYMDMLERTTKAMKQAVDSGEDLNDPSVLSAPLAITCDINLHCSALIPDDYLPDVHQRLLLYKRISATTDNGGLLKLRIEMLDRFGKLPETTERLFEIHKIRLIADSIKVTKIDANKSGARIAFAQNTPVDAIKIITLIQKQPNRYRMDGVHGLRILAADNNNDESFSSPNNRINTIKAFLKLLTS